MKRFVSAFLAGAIVLLSVPAALAANDLNGHWAKTYIEYMSSLDIMKASSDGSYKPDQKVTRAEFMRYMNRAFHFTEKADISQYTDVKQYDSTGAETWYYEPIQIAVKEGYINGVSKTKMDPTGDITREQAATILGRLHKYTPSTDTSSITFSDKSKIGNWSISYIADATAKGYLSGYPDGTFRPTGTITRGELAKLLYQFMGTSLGTSGGNFTSSDLKSDTDNVTISEPCSLSDVTIPGDLYITEGVLDGAVSLSNVTVKGSIIVAGGSVTMDGVSADQLVVSSPVNRLLQITASGATNIGTTEIQSSATLKESSLATGAGGFSDVDITGSGTPAVTLDGNFWNVTADSAATISTTSSSTIDHLTANKAVTVSGYGTIRVASLNASGCNLSMEPTTLELGSGVSATVAGAAQTSEDNGAISPSTATWDVADTTDTYLDFTCENIDNFSKLSYNGTALTENTDYRITTTGLRIYSTWLSGLSVGTYKLTGSFTDDTNGIITLKVVNSAQSTTDSSSATFDKYTSSDGYANVSTGLTLASGAVLTDIRLAGAILTRGDAYTYNSATGIVTLQKDYLAKLSTGSYTVTFIISNGNNLTMALNIEDSSPKNELSATSVSFDSNTASGGYQDVSVTLSTANDATLTSITGGGNTLEPDWQYTYDTDSGAVVLSKAALTLLKASTKKDYLDLTFNMSTGISPVLRINYVTTYPIVVNVTDDQNTGLSGVKVTVAPASTDDSTLTASQTLTTDSSGQVTAYVTTGNYTVTASGGKMSTAQSRSITARAGGQTVSFSVTVPMTVSVYVVTSIGAAIPNATVTLGGQSATTDSSGLATFSIARGSYTLRAAASGYTASSQALTVSSDTVMRIKMAASS